MIVDKSAVQDAYLDSSYVMIYGVPLAANFENWFPEAHAKLKGDSLMKL